MDMENLGTEVSAKIRSAIKAKLVELNAYVDDELPDYIMVMIANKKTEEQMQEDLTLFLNEKAPTFSQWLHSVLTKLQKVTFGGNIEAKKSKAAKKSKGIENIKKKNKPNATASNEKSKEKTGETAKDSKLSPTNTFATDKLPEKNTKDKSEPAFVGKDGDNFSKDHKKSRKSRSRSSSSSFSVSKSPSPSRDKFRKSRSPIESRNKSRSPVNKSPLGYRDYRKNRGSYNDSRKHSYERDVPPKSRNHYDSYERRPPRVSTSHHTNERNSNYESSRPRHMQHERREHPSYRKSPTDCNNRNSRLSKNNQERSTRNEDYQRDRRYSPQRNKQRSRSPVPSPRQNTRKRSYSPPPNRNRSSSGRRNEESFKERSVNKREIERTTSRKDTQNTYRNRSHSNSNSPSNDRKLTSSIGAVISHESDGEYDPEKILKKSIVASKVSVTSRPSRVNKGANPKIVRKAAMDAEMDIRRKKIDAKKRREELKEEEINRRVPTQGRGWTTPDRKMEYPEEVNNKKVKRRHKESRHEEDEDCIKRSRTVRKVRNGEIITPRKAAMDRESEAINSKLRKSDDKDGLRKRSNVRSDEKSNQEYSYSNESDNELPDLRQRLVDRKHKKHDNKQEYKQSSVLRDTSHQKHSSRPNMDQKNIEPFDSEDEEHFISGELKYDRHGRNIIPKNLRIRATIRNDRHDELNNSEEEYEKKNNENSKDLPRNRKRRDEYDEKYSVIASKKVRSGKSGMVDEEEDELIEMRRKALESMRRRKETSNIETTQPMTPTKKKPRIEQEHIKIGRHRQNAQNTRNKRASENDRQVETVKQEILEIQEGDSDAISSISSVEGEADMSDVSENTAEEYSHKRIDTAKDVNDEDSEISLSSSEAEDEVKTRIPIHTTNKSHVSNNAAVINKKKPDSDKKDPQFIVTLDGINSAYFKKEDKEVSKGGLKLKKHEPTSQTVYITSNRAPIMTGSVPSISHIEKPVILPFNKVHDESYKGIRSRNDKGNVVEKPRAMVAPLRKDTSLIISSNTNIPSSELSLNSTIESSNTATSLPEKSSNLKENANSDSKDIPKRKRILPPELSPTESPHSVLAGTNRYVGRSISQSSTHSPGIMSICKYWPNCSRGKDCHYYHPKGTSSKDNLPALSLGPKSDKFKWTSESARP